MTECNHEDKYWVPRDEDPGCEDGKWVCRDCGAEREKGYRPFLEKWRLPRTNPIALRGERVHIAENEMEPGRVYSIKYGKKTLAIVKTADGKIHVCAGGIAESVGE